VPVGTRTEWDLVEVERALGQVADRSFAGEDIAAADRILAEVPVPHTMREVRQTHWGLVPGFHNQVPLGQVLHKREIAPELHKQGLVPELHSLGQELVHRMALRLRKEQERANPMGLDCFAHWSAQGRPSEN
jgi:hypothetical protein